MNIDTEALKAAIKKVAQPSTSTKYLVDVDDLIAELTKPVWTPKAGEYYLSGRHLVPVRHVDCSTISNSSRPITASEIGLEPFDREYRDHIDDSWKGGYNEAIDHVNNTLFPDK